MAAEPQGGRPDPNPASVCARLVLDRDNRENLTPSVAKGKHLWEVNNCVGCHSLLGEGAYFAPELANAFQRLDGKDSIKGLQRDSRAGDIPALSQLH